MPPQETPKESSDFLVILIAVPVLGVLLGGIYSLPAMRITKCREPIYTALLGVGLAVTVFSIGFAAKLPVTYVVVAYSISLVMLSIRRAFGPLDHNVERFGIIHALTLAGMGWLVLLT